MKEVIDGKEPFALARVAKGFARERARFTTRGEKKKKKKKKKKKARKETNREANDPYKPAGFPERNNVPSPLSVAQQCAVTVITPVITPDCREKAPVASLPSRSLSFTRRAEQTLPRCGLHTLSALPDETARPFFMEPDPCQLLAHLARTIPPFLSS